MANIITQWLNPNNWAELRDKFNAVVAVLSEGTTGQYLRKSGDDNGEFEWINPNDYNIVLTDLGISTYEGTIGVINFSTKTKDILNQVNLVPNPVFTPLQSGLYLFEVSGTVRADETDGSTNLGLVVQYDGGANNIYQEMFIDLYEKNFYFRAYIEMDANTPAVAKFTFNGGLFITYLNQSITRI